MALFKRHEDERRNRLALMVAMAAHAQRNTPLFPKATTDRLEDAADELMDEDIPDNKLSFETVTVVKRILEAVRARNPDRPWSVGLIDALRAIEDDD